jgi:hypothetical protein
MVKTPKVNPTQTLTSLPSTPPTPMHKGGSNFKGKVRIPSKAAAKQWYDKQVQFFASNKNYKLDLSAIDRKLCIALAENGFTRDEAKRILLEVSPNIRGRHSRLESYLESKVEGLRFDEPSLTMR